VGAALAASFFTHGPEPTPAVLFLLAVTLTARFAGMGPALFATVGSTLLLDYFFVGQIHAVEGGGPVYALLAIFVLVAVLISSLHAAQRRLEATLRTHNRRQGQFVAVLAHELRNFLAPIPPAVEVLRSPKAGEEGCERARAILERHVQGMARLVD